MDGLVLTGFAGVVVLRDVTLRELSMEEVAIVGLDLAKSVFQVWDVEAGSKKQWELLQLLHPANMSSPRGKFASGPSSKSAHAPASKSKSAPAPSWWMRLLRPGPSDAATRTS